MTCVNAGSCHAGTSVTRRNVSSVDTYRAVQEVCPVLVADAVVDGVQVDGREEAGECVACLGLGAVAGEECAGVRVLLDQGVCCVAVGADCGEPYGAVGVGYVVWCGDGICTGGEGGVVDGVYVIDFECDVCGVLVLDVNNEAFVRRTLDSITMPLLVCMNFP